jgi:xanthine dehydrogenase accessory factor
MPVSMATVVKSRIGHTGSKMLFRQDGSTLGSLGNSELEKLAQAASCRVASLGKNEYLYAPHESEIFVEGFTTPPTLVLVGAGHVAKATSRLAHMLGFRIYVIDDRPEFSNKERFPEAEQVLVADYGLGLDQVPINANTFIVVATRGHRYDDIALEAAIKTPASYIGLLGSKRKTILIYQRLAQSGIPPERLKDVHAPIGLNIGALTPEELAVSIVSEIVMHQHGTNGGPMKMDQRYFNRAVEKAMASTTG